MSNTIKKFSAIGLSMTTAVWLSGAAAIMPVASAATVEELQAQIAALLSQIQALQAQLAQAQPSAPTSYTFTKDLTLGSKGDDVKALQGILISANKGSAAAALAAVGATGYFGNLTKAALAEYQAAVGISPAAGYFGPKTRAYVASLAAAPTTPTTPAPTGEGLTAALASDTPSARTIGSGTAFNSALKAVLTAGSKDVKITSITLKKSGFLANSKLNGVDIIDSKGVRHGNVITSINADNTILITMSTDPIVVSAGKSETITVRFNLLTGDYTGTVSFGIESAAAISSDASAVSGTFPIAGVAMNIVNGGSSLASTTLAVLTSTGSSTLNVSDANLQEITRFRVQETASNEGVYLHSLTLYNYGNAGDKDYKDVTLEAQDGTVLATAQPVGQYTTFTLATAYFIDKGLTKDFIIKAKLIGGTTKTINFVVYNNYDIDLRGASTAVSVIPGATGDDTSFPVGNGRNIQTIGSGSLTLSRAADSPSTSVTPGANNVVLAKFNAKPTGENMELRQVSFYIATGSPGIVLTGTVFVEVNGQTVFSTAASSIGVTSATTITLSSYPTLTAGQDSSIVIKGSVNSSATSASNYKVKSFDIINVKRITTGDLLDPSVGTVDGHQLAVTSAALTVTTLSTPMADSVVAGTNDYLFASIQLNGQSSGETVKVTKVTVTYNGSSTVNTDIGNYRLYKDSETSALTTTASTDTLSSPDGSNDTLDFNLSSPIEVTQTTPVTLYLKGNVLSGAASGSTHRLNVASSTTVLTATGKTTGNTLTNGTDITFAGNGQTMSVVSAGTLTLSLVSGTGASPSNNQVVAANTSGAAYFAFKMTSRFETQKITSLSLRASSTAGTSIATTTVNNIKLYEGSKTTPFAQAAQFDSCGTVYLLGGSTGTSTQCRVTFTATDNLLSAPVPLTGVTITVKADVPAGGTAKLGDNFWFLIASTTADYAVKGSVTASTSGTKTGTPAASGASYVTSQNVKIEAQSPTSVTTVGTGSGLTVGVFKVTNNGTAPIYLASSTTAFNFANSGSASTTLTFGLYSSAMGGSSGDASVTYIATSTAYGTSTTIPFDLQFVSEANRKIDGGSYRYLTVKTNGAAASNNTFRLSISALGNALYNIYESDLGYDANLDGDVSDHITGLYVDGLPALETVTAQ